MFSYSRHSSYSDKRNCKGHISYSRELILFGAYSRAVLIPRRRLIKKIRYFSTGDAQVTIAKSYPISPFVVGRRIKKTSKVIWDCLIERTFLLAQSDKDTWKKLASEFDYKWNFPHCLEAINGKHVVIQAPPRCGSEYFNYKKCHSIVLQAVCDGNYEFTLVDIGDAGRQSDWGAYANSKIGYAIDNNLLDIPPACTIECMKSEKLFPYVFVADDAISLNTYMIKSHPNRITNYCLSRTRRVIENAFGVLAARFRIYRWSKIANVETVNNAVRTTVALHDFLLVNQKLDGAYAYCPENFVDRDGPRHTHIQDIGGRKLERFPV